MAAPEGNQFWKMRSSHGRNPIFESPEQLWEACCEYFEWVEANPLWETQYKTAHGEPVPVSIPKMRPMTIGGLCIFLDISTSCWDAYRNREDFMAVTTRVERIIYEHKFAGASADLLNPNIIARDLGLKDQSSSEITGKGGGPVQTETTINTVDPKEAAAQYQKIVKGDE